MLRKILAVAFLGCSLLLAAPKKPQLPAKYKQWLQQDVVYTITDEEKKVFLTLPDDASREQFIQSFWEIRNPSPGSTPNRYKEEHYARIQYANEHFGRQSNTPGWMTDMGRTWILFGKPTSQHAFVGYGQIYPLELWFYENSDQLPSFPGFFNVLFFIPEDIGEYRFYHPFLDGPMKLVRGSQFNTNQDVYNFLKPLGGDVARSAFSLVPSEPVDTQNFQPDMSSDMLVARIQNLSNDPFNVQRIRALRSLHEKVSSYFLLAQDKPLEINSIVLADPTGRYWLDYGVLVDDAKLGKLDSSTGQLQLSVAYRLTTESGELIAEDAEDRAYPALSQNGGEKKFQPFAVTNRIPIEPGAYKFTVDITNRDAGRTYKGEQKIVVGAGSQVTLAGPLLANAIDKVARPDALAPFQYFGVQFHPALERTFHPQEPLRLLFELQQPSGSARDYQVEYVVAHLHNRDSRRTISEDVPASEFHNGSLLKSKTIPLTGLATGDYRLILNLRVSGSNEVVSSANLPMRIEEEAPDLPLYVLTESRNFARPGVAAYMRGLEAMAQKNDSAASEYLKQALEQNPANTFAGQYLVLLYFNLRQFAPIVDLYKKMGTAPFKSSAVTLAQVSVSFSQSGDAVRARDVLVEAMRQFPDDPVLNAAASSLQRMPRSSTAR
ncbi:MAG: GWxTD domain-containing protein [Acidobacteriia bacterium]|nr:GWxTD domain-containing protein [Terriglobia bacterium]